MTTVIQRSARFIGENEYYAELIQTPRNQHSLIAYILYETSEFHSPRSIIDDGTNAMVIVSDYYISTIVNFVA